MNTYPDAILKLIQSLSTLPGIGKKTGERLALHILHAPLHDAETLASDILELKRKVRLCAVCFALSDGEKCRICSNPERDPSLICVVENPADMVAIEKSGVYKGRYHILGGALSPMDGIGPDEIRLMELFHRVKGSRNQKRGTDRGGRPYPSDPAGSIVGHGESSVPIEEVIVATGTDVEGEATASYIFETLRSHPVKLTRIASGVPMGGDLQYVDQVTMQRAMEGRHGF